MVVEQVHLIDVQQAAVGLGQQARLKRPHPLAQGLFNVDRAAKTIFGGPQRQVHHWHLARLDRQALAPIGAFTHLAALQIGIVRRAVVGVARHHVDLGQQIGQGPDRRALAGAPVAHDHHAADARIDHIQQQGQLHLLLADDGGEGEDPALSRRTHGAVDGVDGDCFTGSGAGVIGSSDSTWGGVASAG